MARINIEDQLFTDGRFIQLVGKIGDIQATGLVILAFKLAQTYWLKGELIPKDVFFYRNEFKNLLEIGFAEEKDDGIYISGSKEQFSWLIQRKNAGKKGGRKPKVKRNESGIETESSEIKSGLSESISDRKPQSQSQSQSLNTIPPNPQKGDDGFFETQCNDVAKVWNDYAEDYKLTKIKTPISKDRMDRMRAALKEFSEIDDWSKIICAVGLNDFNLGRNDRGWKADFDWLFHKTKFNYRKMWELYESTNGENDGDKQAGVKPSEDGDAFPF